MQNKLLVKTIVGIAVIAVLFTGYRAFNEFSADPDLGDFNSVGAIAAIETSREGSRAVIFTADGKRIDPPAPSKTDAQDVEVTWTADGQRLFLSSNRESSSFTVHRWNPASQKLEARGLVGRSQGAPFFCSGRRSGRCPAGQRRLRAGIQPAHPHHSPIASAGAERCRAIG